MGFCRECGIELEENGICDSCKERLEKLKTIIEKDECPECRVKLNGRRVCSNCRYNIDLGYKEVDVRLDTTVKFGALDQNQRINTTSREYCPVCGSKLNPNMNTCLNCNFPIKK